MRDRGGWRGVIEEAARQGLALTTLDDALARAEPVPAPADLAVSSWGEGGDLRTWSGPDVADLAWQARRAELALLGAGSRPPDRALRELLALQSSDWAFLAHRGTAGDYPRERARGHADGAGGRARARRPGCGRAGRRGLLEGVERVGLRARWRGAGCPGPGNLAPDLAGWLDLNRSGRQDRSPRDSSSARPPFRRGAGGRKRAREAEGSPTPGQVHDPATAVAQSAGRSQATGERQAAASAGPASSQTGSSGTRPSRRAGEALSDGAGKGGEQTDLSVAFRSGGRCDGHTRRGPSAGARIQSQRNVRGASRMRMSLAGIPPTTALLGTLAVTTELVPMTALSPTRTPRSRQAP